ncbi:MAG: TIGR00159 family protein, partial [Rhizobacter sp.]|nr:TIGR00159 family protein [Chlorobiales bacterium]
MDLFKVGFLNFTLRDLADVVVVTFLFYKLYGYMKGTVAGQIFVGLLLILAGSAAASFLNLSSLDWLLTKLTDIWFIFVVVLFQPEIRRLLLFIGQSRFFSRLFRGNSDEFVTEVTGALGELADKHHG